MVSSANLLRIALQLTCFLSLFPGMSLQPASIQPRSPKRHSLVANTFTLKPFRQPRLRVEIQ